MQNITVEELRSRLSAGEKSTWWMFVNHEYAELILRHFISTGKINYDGGRTG
jgi:hypothetical protein